MMGIGSPRETTTSPRRRPPVAVVGARGDGDRSSSGASDDGVAIATTAEDGSAPSVATPPRRRRGARFDDITADVAADVARSRGAADDAARDDEPRREPARETRTGARARDAIAWTFIAETDRGGRAGGGAPPTSAAGRSCRDRSEKLGTKRSTRRRDARGIAMAPFALNTTHRAPPLREILQLSLSSSARGETRDGGGGGDDDGGGDDGGERASRRAAGDRSIARKARALFAAELNPGWTDTNALERVANAATCVPFFACGLDVLRRAAADDDDDDDSTTTTTTTRNVNAKKYDGRRATRRWGRALLGVGAFAAAYHLAPRRNHKTRALLRHADFTSIAFASTVASDAFRCDVPRPVLVVSAAAAPATPLLVSAAHCALVEREVFRAAWARRRGGGKRKKRLDCAAGDPRVVGRGEGARDDERRADWSFATGEYGSHVVAAAGAAFFFAAEEIWPDAPLLHATWHVFAYAALSTANAIYFRREEKKPPPPRSPGARGLT